MFSPNFIHSAVNITGILLGSRNKQAHGDDLYAYGFISSYYSSFPSRSNDVTAFTQALFNTKEQEFKEKYANFGHHSKIQYH